MTRVLHVVTGFEVGGAERMLARLLDADAGRGGIEHRVLGLGPPGPVIDELRASGIDARAFGVDAGRARNWPAALVRLAEATRRFEPHAIQGWMYHGNLVASVLGVVAAPRAAVAWNVRQSLEIGRERPSTARVIGAAMRLPWTPAAVVYNSRTAADGHAAFGFPGPEVIVPNGFDLRRFAPRHRDRASLASAYGLDPGLPWIGYVARVHPLKDHGTFLRAARHLAESGVRAACLLVGEGTHAYDGEGVRGLGPVADPAALIASLDVAASSSASEAFPNAVGEAMASGVVPVATAVGDVPELVGECGRVVPPGDAAALADALAAVLALDPAARARLGAAARRRIEERYSLERCVERYRRLWLGLASSGDAGLDPDAGGDNHRSGKA